MSAHPSFPPSYAPRPVRRVSKLASRLLTGAALWMGAVTLDAVWINVAQAQAQTERQTDFDIPAQSLSGALTLFGRQAGLQLSVDPALVAARTSAAVTGRMTATAALAQLLSGSGLTFRFTDPGTVVLSQTQANGATLLAPVSVVGAAPTGASETPRGPTAGYVATRSASATKTDTPLLETAQSVSVVTREQMEDQGSKTVMQAMRYTPGAFTGQVGASNRYDYVILRGMVDRSIDNVYLDGLKMMGDDSTYSSMQVDPYFLERIDAVKGPSSVLYGRSSPGGLIDLSSKRPLFDAQNQMEVTYGSRDQRGLGFDLTGPVGDGQHVAYRLVGTAHAADTQFDYAREERYALSPSVTLKNDDTSLTLLSYFQKDPEGGTHNGVPADGALMPHNGSYVSRHFFDGEPDRERFERTQAMAGYSLEHRFDPVWSVRQNARYLDASVDIDQIYQIGWNGSSNTLNRYYSGGHETLRAFTIDNQVQADFDTVAVRHTVVGGIDYQTRTAKTDWLFGSVAGINPFNPVYGNNGLSNTSLDKKTRDLDQTGLYLQDQIAWDHWRLSLGGRQDWASTETRNRLQNTAASEDRQKLTKRAGLLYLFDNGIAPYASYSESFNPSLYSDAQGKPLKPTEGTQYEAGVKYQPPGSRSLVSAALFTIDQKNVAIKDPVTYVYSPVGTIRSRGLELESHLQLTDEFRLMAGYSLIDAKYTESPDGNQDHGATQVPKHMASLWGEYAFSQGWLRYLSVGTGVRYVGSSWADRANTTKLPSYTVADMSARYDLEGAGITGAEFRLNVTNLFDKTYVASCYELSNCYWGEERTVTGTLAYKF